MRSLYEIDQAILDCCDMETGEIIDRTLYINGNVGYELDPYLEL